MSRVAICVNGIEVHGNSREPLLDQLEKAGFQPEYQCRNGMCGACRCKLKSGAVDQQDAMAFIAPSEILACCSTPKSNVDIEFEYQLQLQDQHVSI
ncbi:class I ribonucleotide reductase maintenance protein YfaE [Photobacterium sp. DNB23_23_1]|uniref:Class I ribonucleotide reductase maintenance protein YfaE n=1 Tax=Photobacterium pectinilyticum TaxID=2906793 RepID=A0ABT1MYY3_9GAMM|nr:class I ribonucleotide reductase maintenance protein YfaE [Photobacterium sp. ZSDE20]MCQ1057695.1 class I ribonucleotide reductase maintenance protein YfaE [Photobacterium sp. ZSDE20]MDD1822094.1 class I ribonucleotide reductase maintenance protein YfaE [Photobacterium sp. ZSDE20]